jgi:hypothetical protein
MSRSRRANRTTWRATTVAAVCVVAVLGLLIPGAGAQDVSGSEDIDVLTATREEVRSALAELDASYAAQLAEVERAETAARDASEEVERAEARVALAEHQVEMARETVAEYAVEAYIRPPAQDSLRVLSLAEAEDASYASSVIQILTSERHKVVDILVAKQAEADEERSKAEAAADRARSAASTAQVKLVELDRLRAEQQTLASSLDERLDQALAEVAALAEIDRQMAEQLAAEELALRQAGPASPPQAVLTAAPTEAAVPDTTAAPPQGPPSPAQSPPPAQSRPPAPRAPTTRPPTTSAPAPRPPSTTGPTGTVTWNDVTSVGGIWVHKSIATNVRNLLNAATAAGFNLAGGGYRDPQAQIATRRANCGPTHYDIYEKPSSQCTPPTATPGRSMHERGLAIDFTSSGSLITSRSNPAFIWLNSNASRYGLYNLPSEPWHWSTNGN